MLFTFQISQLIHNFSIVLVRRRYENTKMLSATELYSSQRDYLFYLQPTYCSLNVNAHQGIMLRQGSVLGYYYYEPEKNYVQRCHWDTTLR